MLHCNMYASISLQLGLEDLIAELRHARRCSELGRLALLAYCDARCWARQAGVLSVAEYSSAMFSEQPHKSRDEFLEQIDHLIFELERVRLRFADSASLHFLSGGESPLHQYSSSH